MTPEERLDRIEAKIDFIIDAVFDPEGYWLSIEYKKRFGEEK